MLADNSTPYAALGFEDWHRDGRAMAVIAVRARYELSPDGALSPAQAHTLVLADKYAGDPQHTALIEVSDLVPFKPQADVTVLANSYPPKGERSTRWLAGVRVNRYEAIVQVNGVRQWLPKGEDGKDGWELGPARGVERVPLDYRYASGGKVFGDTDGDCDPRNPLGEGLLDAERTPRGKTYFAAMIDAHEAPVAEPFVHPEPQGFAPVPPWWRWREHHAGTRDQKWIDETCPRVPGDFDYRFYQSAHPKLRLQGFLRGDELIELACLQPQGKNLSFRLPGVQPYARFSWIDGREVSARLNCDGLHIDMRTKPPYRVDLTWRGWSAICPQFFKIDLFEARLGDAALTGLVWSGEDGLTEAQS